ncbi:MAG: DUF4349 domain-containing protein [Tissierellia bacterium]|nr:DUF4349 domain-containing protein [Tissierellia bacterium]
MNFDEDLKKALEDYDLSLVEHYEKLPYPERRRTMKGRKFYYVFGGIAAVLVLVLAVSLFNSGMMGAKSSSSNYTMDSYKEEMGYAATPEEAPMEDMDYYKMDEGPQDLGAGTYSFENEKIIRTYNLDIETKDIAKAIKEIEALVAAQRGYIESSEYSGKLEVGENAYAYYTLRIPRGKLEDIRTAMEELGQILSFSQYADNITKAYRDTESRIELLKLKEDKLKELLDRAENLEDIITIESQIMDIQYEREQITSNLKDMDDRVDYDTYYISIRQVKTYTEKTFSQKFKDSFGEGLRNFGYTMEDFALFFGYNWAYLLVMLGLGLGLFFGIRARRSKKL